MNSAVSTDMVKSTDIIIVVLKSNFSNPLLVWFIDPPSLPPKAPPAPALDCCNNIIATRTIARATCIHGSIFIKSCIWEYYISFARLCNQFVQERSD